LGRDWWDECGSVSPWPPRAVEARPCSRIGMESVGIRDAEIVRPAPLGGQCSRNIWLQGSPARRRPARYRKLEVSAPIRTLDSNLPQSGEGFFRACLARADGCEAVRSMRLSPVPSARDDPMLRRSPIPPVGPMASAGGRRYRAVR